MNYYLVASIVLSLASLSLAVSSQYRNLKQRRRLKELVARCDELMAGSKELEKSFSDIRSEINQLQNLWVVGQYRFGNTGAIVWDLQGVFSSKEKAVAACKADKWFAVKATLDQELPEDSVEQEVVWPLLEEVKRGD